MEPQQAQENGYKTVKMLPPVKLPTGQEVPISADLAAGVLLSLWELDDGETFGKHIVAAMGGKKVQPGRRGRPSS